MRGVAVTGLGAVSACGNDAAALWGAVHDGRSGIGPIAGFDTADLRIRIAGEVKGFDPETHFDPAHAAVMDRFAQFGVVAARAAISDAGLAFDERARARTATVIGTAVGGQHAQETNYLRLYGKKSSRVHPFVVPRIMANSAASHITMEFGFTGPAFAVTSACASAAHAIGQGLYLLRAGIAEVAICGGAESCITLGGIKSWEALRVLADDTCRPFSRDRRGLVLAEGAAVLVLEPLERARARGARIHAELAGFGMSADATDLVRPSAKGAAQAILAALCDARLEPREVDYVNAHGTGTKTNDVTETRALRRAFGHHAKRLAVSSTKAVHGHALGAAPALEAVATILALRQGVAPPTANFTEPDPECDLDFVREGPRAMNMNIAISNAFAFGGLNAVLVFKRCAT
ncbi:MAG: beta-ketoacyl-[acyl-carrier-protein] synthase family protein [Alphaproteobacteria bacterium]